MAEHILLGREDKFIRVPQHVWESHYDEAPEHGRQRLAFMSSEHHRVRYFVVRELPRSGKAIQPATISKALELPLDRVSILLDDLEKNLTFLYRNDRGAVAWAYPVTIEETLHQVRFSSGERLYGA